LEEGNHTPPQAVKRKNLADGETKEDRGPARGKKKKKAVRGLTGAFKHTGQRKQQRNYKEP